MPDRELVAEQFEDAQQQLEASTLGMWTFLATEVLFFGTLFVAYAMMRTRWPQAFVHGSRDLHIWLGGINTAVLLTSSLFVALAVRSAALGRSRRVMIHLLLAAALGLAFLAVKGVEYHKEYQEALIPTVRYSAVPPTQANLPPQLQEVRPERQYLFMVFYFIMTAFHALHVLIGVAVLGVIAVLAWRGRFSRQYYNPVEISGLYWHFVDIVWVFLYPALYLLRQG